MLFLVVAKTSFHLIELCSFIGSEDTTLAVRADRKFKAQREHIAEGTLSHTYVLCKLAGLSTAEHGGFKAGARRKYAGRRPVHGSCELT